jgi:hypothetical protein
MVISGAGTQASHLIYLAAMAAGGNQTIADESAISVTPGLPSTLRISDDGASVTLEGPNVADVFYNRCAPSQVEYALSAVRASSAGLFGEFVETPAWIHRPATYFICADDHAVLPSYQRERGSQMSGARTLSADHSAFYSATQAVADGIMAVVAEVCGN